MFKVNPDVYLSVLYKDDFGVPVYSCKINFNNKKISNYDIELLNYDNLSGLSNIEIVLKNYCEKNYYCLCDLKYNNMIYRIRYDLTFSNFILLFENLSFEKGISNSKVLFYPPVLAESDKSNLLIPLLNGYTYYDNYISELNKVKDSVVVKSEKIKITKTKIKPFTFYKDSLGDTYCILGVFSRYIKNTLGVKKAVREYAVLKNINDIDNFSLTNFNEIKLNDIIFKNKIDFYEEIRSFSDLSLSDFIDYYNLNHSLLNPDYFSKVLTDRSNNNNLFDYNLKENYIGFMHNQAIPLFLKSLISKNISNELITNEFLIDSYLQSLSLTDNFKSSLLTNKLSVLDKYFEDKVKEGYCEKPSNIFNYESKYQIPYARYSYEKFIECIIDFENKNTLYLTNKCILSDSYFYKASLYKDLDVNIIYDNLISYLAKNCFSLTYYVDDENYYKDYHSSNLSYRNIKNTSKGFINKNKSYFDNSTYRFLDIYSISDDLEFAMLIECFRYNRY